MDRATFAFSTEFFQDFGNSALNSPPQEKVDFIAKPENFGYCDFFRDFLLPNRPCVFSAEFTRGWASRASWATPDGKPNFEFLLKEFGSAEVPVAQCDLRQFNAHPKELLPLREFLEYWREFMGNGHRHPRGILYLKDWHWSRAFPGRAGYSTPVYFSSDWLNEFWDAAGGDDFRFVYMGPKGSWTPFHADVFRSYSWSANVCGRKRWLLFPPGQEELLRDPRGNLPFDLTAPQLRDPGICPRSRPIPAPLEILQGPGEIVFVPSGWHHQVHNLEDTISINHNWVNGCNVSVVWSFLQEELAAVQRELSQWSRPGEDWPLQCQLIMKSCTGIDYKEFYNFLKVIAENRISVLEKGLEEESPSRDDPGAALGPLHALFDLRRAGKVLGSLTANEDFRKLELSSLSPHPEVLLQRLQSATDTALL